jgi:hypothetical protein
MNRSGRTSSAELLQAQRHHSEHQALNGRLEELTAQMRQLTTLIDERRDEYNETVSQTARELIRREIARLEAQNAEIGAQYSDVLGQISDLRSRADAFDGRLTTVETRTIRLRGDVDGLQGRTDSLYHHVGAHATAIARLEAANGWVPVASAAVAGLATYLAIELFRSETATHIQWAWTLAGAAVIGLIVSLMSGAEQVRTQSSASSSAGSGGVATVTPATPTTVQPALTPDAVAHGSTVEANRATAVAAAAASVVN